MATDWRWTDSPWHNSPLALDDVRRALDAGRPGSERSLCVFMSVCLYTRIRVRVHMRERQLTWE